MNHNKYERLEVFERSWFFGLWKEYLIRGNVYNAWRRINFWTTIEKFKTEKEAKERLKELQYNHFPTVLRTARNRGTEESITLQVLKAYKNGGGWVYVKDTGGKYRKFWSAPFYQDEENCK